MALSKPGALGITAAIIVLAGAAAWFFGTPSTPGTAPRSTAPPSSPDSVPPAPPPPIEGKASPLPPMGTGCITGRLVRGAATNPVEGVVTVALPGAAPASVRTAGRGYFRVDGLPVETPLSLTAEAPGTIPARLPDLRIPVTGILDLGDLEMGSGVTLEVLVTRGAMQPAEGIVVTLIRLATERDDAEETWRPPGMARPPASLGTSTTDAAGRASFRGTPPGDWFLRAEGAGFAAAQAGISFRDGETIAPLRIHLVPACSLSGTIRGKGGLPAAGVEIFAGIAGWRFRSSPVALRAVSGADGRYRIEGLGMSSFDVFVRPPGGLARWVNTVRIPDLSTLDIALEEGDLPGAGVTLKGRIVEEAGGAGVAGARILVEVSRRRNRGESPVTAAAETGSDGSFEIGGLPAGSMAMATVRKPGYLTSHLEGLDAYEDLAPGESLDLMGRLDRGGAVRGTVTDSTGTPLPGVVVRFVPVESGENDLLRDYSRVASARSREDGTYRISPCFTGKGTMSIVAPGLLLAGSSEGPAEVDGSAPVDPSSVVEVAPGGEAVKDLVLSAAGVVEGAVRNAAGEPRAGFTVEIMEKDSYDVEAEGPPTDAEGRFRVEGVGPGKALVVAVRGLHEKGESAPFDIDRGGTIRDVAVTVGAMNAVAGRVRSRDGTPLVDPRIYCVMGDLDHTRMPWRMVTDFGSMETPGPDGSFRFEDVYPAEHGLVAFARGCSPGVVPSVDVEETGVVEGIDIILDPGRSLSGTVVDEAGDPVGGAEVLLFAHPKSLMTDDELRQVTGVDGRFALADLVEGWVDLIVRSAGRPDVRTTVETGKSDLVLTVEEGRRISGTVVDGATGKGIPGVEILVREPGSGMRPAFLDALEGKETLGATSDAEGRFSVADLASGSYTVTVGTVGDREAAAPAFSPLEIKGVKAGTEDLVLRLEPGLSIAGRLVDTDGTPILEALPVEVVPVEGNGGPDRRRRTEWSTNADGTFRIQGLPAGTYELSFNAGRSSIASRSENPSPFAQTVVPEVPAGTEGLIVTVARGLPISGKVMDEDGNPPADSGILRIHPSRREEGEAFVRVYASVDEEGRFTTPALAPGRTYDIQAYGFEGLTDGAARGVEPGAKDVVLRLTRGPAIAGRLVLPDGRPAPEGISVKALSFTERGGRDDRSRSRTMKDGTFRITGLEAAAYVVVGGGDGSDFAPTRADGSCKPGDAGVEIRLEPGFTISGVLVDADGNPVKERTLSASQRAPFDNHCWGKSTGTGSFIVKGLARGRVRVSVFTGEGATDLGEFEVPASDLRITVKAE